MDSSELTDRDGDALTITMDDGGAWITCTSGDREVTVGPFLTAVLGSVLTQGKNSRAESPSATRATRGPVTPGAPAPLRCA